MIVKVQRPLNGNLQPGSPSILVYSEGREHMDVLREEDLPHWLRTCLQDEAKIYVEATHDHHGWKFLRRDRGRPW